MAALRAGALDGGLPLDAFTARVEAAYAARYVEELDALVEDLPGAVPEVEVRVSSAAPAVTVGRDRECDVVVGDSSVARRHAELRHRRGRWFVRDLGSFSGTWLNGRRVKREAPVAAGDVLKLGALRLDLRL